MAVGVIRPRPLLTVRSSSLLSTGMCSSSDVESEETSELTASSGCVTCSFSRLASVLNSSRAAVDMVKRKCGKPESMMYEAGRDSTLSNLVNEGNRRRQEGIMRNLASECHKGFSLMKDKGECVVQGSVGKKLP